MKKAIMGVLCLLTVTMFSCNDLRGQGIALYKTTSVNGTIDSMVTTQPFDTLVNTGVKYLVSKAAFAGIDRANYTLSFYTQSLTGTPATVNFVWEGSFDGYTWFRMTNAYGIDGLNCDTLRITPSTTATQHKFVSKAGAAKLVSSYAATPVYNMGMRVWRQRLRMIPTGTQTLRVFNPSIFSFE